MNCATLLKPTNKNNRNANKVAILEPMPLMETGLLKYLGIPEMVLTTVLQSQANSNRKLISVKFQKDLQMMIMNDAKNITVQ
jgi:hypothetical protein